jgi:ankyrin repeat protein
LLLLDAKAEKDQPTVDGITPLSFAAQLGHSDIVKLLLDRGVNKNQPDLDGATPLYIASQLGRLDVVKMLVAAKVDINFSDIENQNSLYVATQAGRTDVAEFLIEAGIDVHQINVVGWTMMHVAAQEGRADLVLTLANAGVDVNKIHHDGWAPIHVASQFGHLDVVKQLIQAGADLSLSDSDGVTALVVAAEAKHLPVVHELLISGAHFSEDCETLLEEPIENWLIQRDEWTPLHYAIAGRRESIVMGYLRSEAEAKSVSDMFSESQSKSLELALIEPEVCIQCGQKSILTCAACGLVNYCSIRHQADHWQVAVEAKSHKMLCTSTAFHREDGLPLADVPLPRALYFSLNVEALINKARWWDFVYLSNPLTLSFADLDPSTPWPASFLAALEAVVGFFHNETCFEIYLSHLIMSYADRCWWSMR